MPVSNKTDSREYSKVQDFRMVIPFQFLLICRLIEIPPQKVLYDFMANVGQENYGMQEEQKLKATEYFLSCGYQGNLYSESQMHQLFNELKAIGLLWPKDAKMNFITAHSKWRARYHKYLYRKWFWKPKVKAVD